jgi:hypothetical protein
MPKTPKTASGASRATRPINPTRTTYAPLDKGHHVAFDVMLDERQLSVHDVPVASMYADHATVRVEGPRGTLFEGTWTEFVERLAMLPTADKIERDSERVNTELDLARDILRDAERTKALADGTVAALFPPCHVCGNRPTPFGRKKTAG